VGLFTGLILLPLAPVRGVAWLGEQVLEQATREAGDPAEIGDQLERLDDAEAAGEITADERAHAQDELVAELMQARTVGWSPPERPGSPT
jgi:hypothetical protein